MQIALDENLPSVLRAAIEGPHSVSTVQELGLSGTSNGELLAILEGQFDVFVTADKRLKYQQNLSNRTLAIVESPTNRLPLLSSHYAEIAAAILAAKPGDYVIVNFEISSE